jgi:hypothetical protein
MNPVNVRVVGCQVRLDWVAPKHFEQENIEDYDLQLKSHDGSWNRLTIDHCVTDIAAPTWGLLRNSCIVAMDTLSNEPFLLDDDDFLYVRAKASYQPPTTDPEDQRWSPEYSCWDDCAGEENKEKQRMIGDPERVPDLEHEKTLAGHKLSWDTAKFDGGNYMYELWWCEGACASGYEKVTETAVGTFTVNLLGIRGTYKFIVRAISPCGDGQFSNPTTIEISAVPSQVQDIKVFEQRQDCGAILRWSRPLVGEPITGYDVQIMGEDDLWHNTNNDCGVDPAVAMCTVSMQML